METSGFVSSSTNGIEPLAFDPLSELAEIGLLAVPEASAVFSKCIFERSLKERVSAFPLEYCDATRTRGRVRCNAHTALDNIKVVIEKFHSREISKYGKCLEFQELNSFQNHRIG